MKNINYKTMRKIAFTLLMLLTLSLNAQDKDVVKFMGIPVDGSKSEMISQLKKKGFEYDGKGDCLQGRFNGEDVFVCVLTEKGIVYRVGVAYQYRYNEEDIKIRYNTLLRQFMQNERYSLYKRGNYIEDDERSRYIQEHQIGENERISKQIRKYQVGFNQTYSSNEKEELLLKIEENYEYYVELLKEDIPDYKDYTGEDKGLIKDLILTMLIHEFEMNNTVWFEINTSGYDGYIICIYYDNLLNAANGEDL